MSTFRWKIVFVVVAVVLGAAAGSALAPITLGNTTPDDWSGAVIFVFSSIVIAVVSGVLPLFPALVLILTFFGSMIYVVPITPSPLGERTVEFVGLIAAGVVGVRLTAFVLVSVARRLFWKDLEEREARIEQYLRDHSAKDPSPDHPAE